MMDDNELIQQARKCAVCMIGADECHRESCKIDNCADTIDLLADALEAAQKEIEQKDFTILGIMHSVDKWLDGDELNQDEVNRAANMREKTLRIVESLTARAEKAEAKIKSIHESLNFADKSRSKCANYVELAVSNGLALGKIAVSIQHDYDAEPPKGE